MKLLIDTKSVKILDEEIITSGGFNNTILDVEFSDEYKNLVTFITFNNIKRMVIGNKINVPTLEEGICQIGAYGIETVNDETILRYSPQPICIQIKKGSYNEHLSDPTLPTQSEYEAMLASINQAIEDGKLKGDKGDKGEQGEKGEKGESGVTDNYAILTNKPKINNVELGDNSLDELNIQKKLTTEQMENIDAVTKKNDKTVFKYQLPQNNILSTNTEYRLGTIDSLTISLPQNPDDDYITSIVFHSSASATLFTNIENIKLSGDDTIDNIFTPESNKTYEIIIYWNGNFYSGIAKGWS